MADIKTYLRELSVATTIGLYNQGIPFSLEELYQPQCFWRYAQVVITNDISDAVVISRYSIFSDELKQIIQNGYHLGKALVQHPHFTFQKEDTIYWIGNDTQKENPIDITVGTYGFSLKEESFILENMGLYKLLNCYTGSKYRRRHIFKDYAPEEYAAWFTTAWKELITYLTAHHAIWQFRHPQKTKSSVIRMVDDSVFLEAFENEHLKKRCILPLDCTLKMYEKKTTAFIRENVFSKFIKETLNDNNTYNTAKRMCAIAASNALAKELNDHLDYHAGLPSFLRIHKSEYYYAKTTSAGIKIYKVPSLATFGNHIVIDSIVSSVPKTQANILTTIRNTITGNTLILRNECRFSHGQFNGVPEAKMYYEYGGSLLVIYETL